MGRPVVRAAGGVVWRPGRSGDVEVLAVHRPKYDDWTLPKGKADPGESDEDCARREVAEETGLDCVLGEELASASYRDSLGRPKRVRYWAMTPVVPGAQVWANPAGRTGGEIDEVRWVGFDAAGAMLTYQRDRQVLASWRRAGRRHAGT